MAKNKSSELAGKHHTFDKGEILGIILEQVSNIDTESNQKANFIIGISGLLMVYSLSQISSTTIEQPLSNNLYFGWLTIGISSAISLILSIIAIKPTVHGEKERLNLYWPGSYLKKLSRAEYVVKVKEMLSDNNLIINEIIKQSYDYAKFDAMPRVRGVKLATESLIIGLIAGAILIIL